MKFKLLILLLLTHSLSIAGDAIEQGLYAFEKKDYALAIKKFKPFSDADHAQAQYYMAIIYFNGYGIEQSKSIAKSLFKKAAIQNYIKAQLCLDTLFNNSHSATNTACQHL